MLTQGELSMTNITHINPKELLTSFFSNFYSNVDQLAFPLETNFTVFNFANMMESLNDDIYSFALILLQHAIKEIDDNWRNRPDRTSTYYVQQYRPRTIITLFGELTYDRTIYSVKATGESYCHVDSMLGLLPHIKYDPCGRAKAAELYSFHNSMLKVGRIIGDQIFCNFSTKRCGKDDAIPRQTIPQFLLDFGMITTSFAKRKETPNHLYIMADEKWIPTQDHDKNGKPKKLMDKAVVIFEECENAYNSSKNGRKQRHKLTNKTRILGTERDIWKRVEEALYQMYDVEKIEFITIMGDGANWIKAGASELTNASYSTEFVLDSFHLNQALLRIEHDKEIRQGLRDSIYELKDKSIFKNACFGLIHMHPEKEAVIQRNMNYILNHWTSIMKRVNECSMPCAMEGAISHDICNSFTSVPKAYMPHNFEIYNRNRMHYLNGVPMLPMLLSAYDKKEDECVEVDLSESYFYHPTSNSSSYEQPRFLKELGQLQNTIKFI